MRVLIDENLHGCNSAWVVVDVVHNGGLLRTYAFAARARRRRCGAASPRCWAETTSADVDDGVGGTHEPEEAHEAQHDRQADFDVRVDSRDGDGENEDEVDDWVPEHLDGERLELQGPSGYLIGRHLSLTLGGLLGFSNDFGIRFPSAFRRIGIFRHTRGTRVWARRNDNALDCGG